MRAYLDHAATTPMRPEALAAMLPYLTEHFGNPSSRSTPGRRALLALDEAREQVAGDLGCEPGEVVFCSGGTEAANMAVSGAITATSAVTSAGVSVGPSGSARRSSDLGDRYPVAVCSAVEHHSVLRSVLGSGGTTLGVGPDGLVDFDALEVTLRGLSDRVAIVAVMLANNEVGTVQPVSRVSELVRAHCPHAVFFVDAVHAVPWLDVAQLCSCADMLAVSAHKFGGPKGVGALVVRDRTRWRPVSRGGEQERGRRPGTENVAGIVAMAAALRVTVEHRAGETLRVGLLRDRLADSICGSTAGIAETGVTIGADGRPDRSNKVAGGCHLSVEGVERDELMFLLDAEGVHASSGSACASGASEASHVLQAMGIDVDPNGPAALRLSLGHSTSEAEIDHAIAIVPKVVEHLRAG